MAALLVTPAMAKDRVTIAYVEWACARTSTHTVAAVLESKGYDVNLLSVSAAAMWQGVASGDVDAQVTAWLPATHADYKEQTAGKVEDLGPLYEGAKLGWVVPEYVTIDSITDLKDNAKKFDKEVIGIDPGAGLMRLSKKAMEEYGLNEAGWELVEGSGATMTGALNSAIKNNEWIVATGWAPHWKFGRWDLKFLDDPKGVLGEAETINTIVRKGLKEDMPKVYKFLDNFKWPEGDFATVMAWNEAKGSDPMDTARRYVKENPDVVKEWWPGE